MEELAAAAAGQQRVGGINGPRDRGTVAQSWDWEGGGPENSTL